MKKILFIILILPFFLNAQEEKKDTLFFKIKPTYIKVKINYEGVHAFIIKNEEFVTSAFKNIVQEDLFFFTQSDFPPKIYRLKPNKVISLKKYLKKYRNLFEDKSTNKLDAYKIMEHFIVLPICQTKIIANINFYFCFG